MQRELSSIAAESDAQMRMFDELGPKAREALNYWPREPNVRTFMREFKIAWGKSRENGADCFVDPPFDDPFFDAAFADYIWKKYRELTGTTIKCLVPRKLQRPFRSRSLRIR